MSKEVFCKCAWCHEAIHYEEKIRVKITEDGKTLRYHLNAKTNTDCLLSALTARLALLKRQYALITGKEYENKEKPLQRHH